MSWEDVGVIKTTVSSYLWEVKNFSTCKNIGDKLVSPVFSTTDSSDKHEWCLWLYPKGSSQTPTETTIFLKYLGKTRVDVKFSLSLLNDKHCKEFTRDIPRLFKAGSLPYGVKLVCYEFINDKKKRIVVNDAIKILCEIIYESNLAVPFKNKCEDNDLPDYSRLEEFDDFEKLLDVENSADVTVKIGNDKIKVHKAIIMNRSPVFQAMFEHEMKEKEQNIVEITDVKYEVMKEVFRFMYAGKVNGVEKIVDDLLVAAEKYSINGLKVMCEKHILKNLTVANVIECLNLAIMCNANNLKVKIIKFIVHNKNDIVHKPELKLLPSEVICEVLSAVVGNKPKK